MLSVLKQKMSSWARDLPSSASSSIDEEKGSISSSHRERHASHSDLVRDFIIGFSDGLTVPFALTAGLSSLGSSRLVVIGGLAELFSGSISMGLGAFLACLQDAARYKAEEARERREIVEKPRAEEEEIYDIFNEFGISKQAAAPVVADLKKDPDQWVQFMMNFELKLEKPSTSRAWISALTMGFAYLFGGILPMIPYFCTEKVDKALFISIGLTAFVLLVFGYIKTMLVIVSQKAAIFGALQTLVVGAIAAGASYGIVKAVDSRYGTETVVKSESFEN